MKIPHRRNDEVNYWESMADTMIGLIFMLLLVIMLLIFYIIKIPDENAVDTTGDSTEEYTDELEGSGGETLTEGGAALEDRLDTGDFDAGSSYDDGDNRGGEGSSAGEEDGHHYDDPDPGAGNGEGTDRSAVQVQLIDAETNQTVKMAGVSFELYNRNGVLQTLSVYYPNRVDYSSFETDSNGTFYLPERLELREDYTLRERTTIGGYDTAQNTTFNMDRSYDWSDPYVVSVYVSPSKNRISVTLKDSSDNTAVGGASFDVVAAADITTGDGTIHYKEGDITDTIVVDDNGKGESGDLYLGKYVLRQSGIPQYYGRIIGDTAVDLSGKSDHAIAASLAETKTSITVTAVDALYDSTLIEGAVFEVTDGSGKVIDTCTTDSEGRFTVTDLKKNTTYHIIQKASVGAYQTDTADHAITISADGLVDGNVNKALTVRNRIIRVAIGVQDKLFRNQVSDISFTMLDADGNTVKTWSSSGIEQSIEGLAPGTYSIIIAGDEENVNYITVENKTDIQAFEFERWTIVDIASIAGAVAAGILLIVLMILLIRRHIKKRRTGRRGAKNSQEQKQ